LPRWHTHGVAPHDAGIASASVNTGQQLGGPIEKLAAWRALRERYGNRDESRVDRGALLALAA